MIKINLIPESLRKNRGSGFLNPGDHGYPEEIVIGIFIAVLAFLLLIHVVLGMIFLYKIAQVNRFQSRWDTFASDRELVGGVLNQIKSDEVKFTAFRPVLAPTRVLWSGFMKDVSSSVPKGVSLKEVSLEKGALVIKGSAVSRKKNEMVLAGQFVENLRQRKLFLDHFMGVEADYSIQRQETALVSIANFNLKARLK